MKNIKQIIPRITVEELKELINKQLPDKIDSNNFRPEKVASLLAVYTAQSQVRFDCENFFISSSDLNDGNEANSLLGFHTLENGITFLGCIANGDWECPVFFILFHDGRVLRAYVPEQGNVFNLKGRCAYGSERCEEDFDIESLKEIFCDHIEDIDGVEDIEELSECLREWAGGLTYDWSKISTDIKENITPSPVKCKTRGEALYWTAYANKNGDLKEIVEELILMDRVENANGEVLSAFVCYVSQEYMDLIIPYLINNKLTTACKTILWAFKTFDMSDNYSSYVKQLKLAI